MELERTNLDEKLLSLARKSPMEIAEATGLDAGFVAERITYLLDSKDWLTDRQEERLILIEAATLKDKAFGMLEDVGPQEFAGVANVVLKTLRLVSERLDARRKIFAQAFDAALQYIIAGFKAFEGVPSDEDVDDLVEQGLKRAGSILDANLFE
jgi:hypothetical protein